MEDKILDTKLETLLHIKRVNQLLIDFAISILQRAKKHDDSKLLDPELAIFAEQTYLLKSLTYGSDEYKLALSNLGEALTHHYQNNDHHPEHFDNGIQSMNLYQVVEMFFDWRAATERHADGDICKSIEINQKRFRYSDDLKNIFLNTVTEFEKLDGEK